MSRLTPLRGEMRNLECETCCRTGVLTIIIQASSKQVFSDNVIRGRAFQELGGIFVTGLTRKILQSACNSQHPISASNIFVNGLSSALYLSQLTIDFMENVKDYKSPSTASALRMGILKIMEVNGNNS